MRVFCRVKPLGSGEGGDHSQEQPSMFDSDLITFPQMMTDEFMGSKLNDKINH